ncbi:hypothetical protein BJX65DRAFT_285483 [Aspergillus insuetus]
MFVEDYNDTAIITTREYRWMPLEVILDSYLQMIDEEKVQTISEDQAEIVKNDPSCEVVHQWIIHHYTKIDLERATTAFKRLVDVIEFRIPHKTDLTTPMNLPWHDPATFSNQDILPPFSFAHKFLKAISNYKSGSGTSPRESDSLLSPNSRTNPSQTLLHRHIIITASTLATALCGFSRSTPQCSSQ